MKVIVTTSFSGHPHGSWGTDRGRVQEMPEETAKMAIAAGFAKAVDEKPAPKKRAARKPSARKPAAKKGG